MIHFKSPASVLSSRDFICTTHTDLFSIVGAVVHTVLLVIVGAILACFVGGAIFLKAREDHKKRSKTQGREDIKLRSVCVTPASGEPIRLVHSSRLDSYSNVMEAALAFDRNESDSVLSDN